MGLGAHTVNKEEMSDKKTRKKALFQTLLPGLDRAVWQRLKEHRTARSCDPHPFRHFTPPASYR